MSGDERRSILCPNCRKLISSDELRCPYCGLNNPSSRWKSTVFSGMFQSPEKLLKLIIYVNAAMFIFSLVVRPRFFSLSLNPFSLLSPDDRTLMMLGATGTFAIIRYHAWWTLLTANYLHGGILHIFFNMMALWQIGPLIIQEYGNSRMIVIYTLGGIVGYLVSVVAGVPITIGASGAVCAMIGAALYYGKSRGGEYGHLIYSQIGGWAVGLFLFGFLVPGINNWAHGGGMITGALIGFLLGYSERTPESRFHKTLAVVCVAATALALSLGIVRGLAYLLLV